MEITFTNVAVTVTFLLSILGWAYQLGRSDARLVRNEKDISELKAAQKQDRRDAVEEVKVIRNEIKEGMNRIYDQLRELPCRNASTRKDC